METILSAIKKPLRNTALYKFAAKKYLSFLNYKQITSEAKRLQREFSVSNSIDKLIAIQSSSHFFRSGQIKTEISQLLSVLADKKMLNIMEIGTRKGGTLFLFSQICNEKAKIISVDYQYPSAELRNSLKYLKKRGQKIFTVEGDSHKASTFEKIKSILHKDLLDFLFIDGDHSYDGVKQDYNLYSNLVKPGGIIAFHDITPDNFLRNGKKTASDVGQVPIFWQELKAQSLDTLEFVENVEQDGFGIGLIFKK